MAETLIRTAERVAEFGEVFTPTHIVQAMHNMLPRNVWRDKSMIYLEPTCGNGNFVVEAVKKKISAGWKALDAVNTTFGLEILKDNVEECRLRVYKEAVKALGNKRNRKLASIIINNIIKVDDSRKFIRSGEWERYTFYDDDPTGENQVKSPKEREMIEKQAKIFLDTHGF